MDRRRAPVGRGQAGLGALVGAARVMGAARGVSGAVCAVPGVLGGASRAAGLGTDAGDGYLLWTPADPYTPLSQEAWPDDLDQGKHRSLPAEPDIHLVMASDTVRAAPVHLRNLGEQPREISVTCGPLEGPAGQFEGRVSWRVIAFAPYGTHRQEWSPFMLMRRPTITVPPWSVAGIWLSVDTRHHPPG